MPVRNKRTFEDYYPGYANEDKPFEIKTVHHNFGTISASGNRFLLVAPSEIKIVKIKLAVDTTVSVSTTNYWTAQLANMTTGSNLLGTADNTNYDTELTADKSYEIAPTQNNFLATGDVLELQLTKVASGANLVGLLVEVEYVVTGVVTTTSTTTARCSAAAMEKR